jgi:streptogramin lyase
MEHNEAIAKVQPWLGDAADVLTSGTGAVYVGIWMDPAKDFLCVAMGNDVAQAVANAEDSWSEYRAAVIGLLPDGVAMDEDVLADQYQMDADPDDAVDALKLFCKNELGESS